MMPGDANQPAAWGDYFEFLIRWEGATFENDPADAGGATMFGIDSASHPGVNVRDLTPRQASALHLADYQKTSAGKLPHPLNFAYFDFAMNAGERAAAKAVQTVCGTSVDGAFGPQTKRMADEFVARNGASLFLSKFSDARRTHYRELARTRTSLDKYLTGWLNRTTACATFCMVRAKEGRA